MHLSLLLGRSEGDLEFCPAQRRPEPLGHARSTSRGLSHGCLSAGSLSKQLPEHFPPKPAGIAQMQP